MTTKTFSVTVFREWIEAGKIWRCTIMKVIIYLEKKKMVGRNMGIKDYSSESSEEANAIEKFSVILENTDSHEQLLVEI